MAIYAAFYSNNGCCNALQCLDLLYTDLQSAKLIQIFWSADPSGSKNEWVKAAYSSASMMSLVLYYLIIAIPLINLVAVMSLSDKVLKFSHQDAMSGLKIGTIKLVAALSIAALLTFFYHGTLNKTMFDGHSLSFKEWGTASSARDMSVNFVKRIVRMGASGNIGGNSSSSDSNLEAYFNNK